jgi:hypothetical protein
MDNILRIKVVCACNLCSAETERPDFMAFLIKHRTCSGMHSKVDSAVTHHFFVGGVDNRINIHFRYILSDDL